MTGGAEDRRKEAKAFISEIDAKAEKFQTPCGSGTMMWRRWGSGPDLVLLHGGTGSWNHWISNIEVLARSRTLWIPDMPAYGGSAEPPLSDNDQPVATLNSIADIIAGGLGTLIPGTAKYDLCGFSFGGVTAGHVAERVQDRLRNLVIVGSMGLGLTRAEFGPLLPLRGVRDPDKIDEILRKNLSILMIADPAKIDDIALECFSVNLRRTRFRESRETGRSDVLRQALSRLRGVRLNGIWGSRDALAHSHMQERRDLFELLQPGAPFHVIDGAGHWVQYEAVEKFNPLLLDLLR